MGALKPWHIIILVVVLVLLFGAKRLPDAARSLGRSLRIIKAETKGLVDDGSGSSDTLGEKADAQYSRQPLQGDVQQPGYQQGYQQPGYQQQPPPAPQGFQQPQPGFQQPQPQQPPVQPYVDPVQRTTDR